jgi:hypothetical protein
VFILLFLLDYITTTLLSFHIVLSAEPTASSLACGFPNTFLFLPPTLAA